MKTIPAHLIKDVDYILKKVTRDVPDYNTNTQSTIAKHYGGMRPDFDNYIPATSSGLVNEANQISKILHNFDYKCKQMTSNLTAKRVGGSRRRKNRKKYSRRKKVKRTYRRKPKFRKKSRKSKR